MNHTEVTHSPVDFPFGAPNAHTYIDCFIRVCVSLAIVHLHSLLVDIVFLVRFWIFFTVIPVEDILRIIKFLVN